MGLRCFKSAARGIRGFAIRRASALWAERRLVTTKPALVVAPHPDDEVLGTGGMIALKRSAGTKVDVAFLTDGEASHRSCCDVAPAEIGRNRRRIAEEAGGIVGLDTSAMHWLHLPDGRLPRSGEGGFEEAVAGVLELLNRLAPGEVYCPHPLDGWADHEAASEIAHEAVRRYDGDCELIYYLVWAWHNLPLGRLPALGWRGARRLDTRPVAQKKRAAVRRYFVELAPGCGRPYSGMLPRALILRADQQDEVYFGAPRRTHLSHRRLDQAGTSRTSRKTSGLDCRGRSRGGGLPVTERGDHRLAEHNRRVYQSTETVAGYASAERLNEPEKAVLSLLGNRLRKMVMLDIGVGGGRTTIHFASLAKAYIGIDYSREMIETCRARFRHQYEQATFQLCDARSMDCFGDDSFDFVLFSLNGLDYMSHSDRWKALREIKRVCRRGGLFCFSSHNLQFRHRLFALSMSADPIRMVRRMARYILLKILNLRSLGREDRPHAIINDGAHRFRLCTYYIRPSAQIRQLLDAGFRNVRLFAESGGRELWTPAELYANTDCWLYYLCNA